MWKYLIIANWLLQGVLIHLQFEVKATSISDAEDKANVLLSPYEIDVHEIRRL